MFKEALSASLSVLEGMAARDCRRERCSPSVRPRPGRRLNGLLGTHGRAEPLSDRVWCLSHTPVPRRAVCRTQAPLPRNGGRRRGHHVRRCPGVVALSGLAAGAWGGQPTGHDTEVAPPSLGRNTGEAGRCARGGGGQAASIVRERIGRMVSGARGQRAGRQPTGRPVLTPSGQPCGRHRRSNAMASRGRGRGRARSGVREVHGTGRSVRRPMRRWAMATGQTSGARSVTDVGPVGVAWRWPCQGRAQPWGSRCARRPAWRLAAWQRARAMGARACTGTTQGAREGSHASRSVARPPPGTRAGMGGWSGRGLPQGCRTPGKAGRCGPLQRCSCARRVRAVADAWPRAWEALG